jgi:hypothetical protein
MVAPGRINFSHVTLDNLMSMSACVISRTSSLSTTASFGSDWREVIEKFLHFYHALWSLGMSLNFNYLGPATCCWGDSHSHSKKWDKKSKTHIYSCAHIMQEKNDHCLSTNQLTIFCFVFIRQVISQCPGGAVYGHKDLVHCFLPSWTRSMSTTCEAARWIFSQMWLDKNLCAGRRWRGGPRCVRLSLVYHSITYIFWVMSPPLAFNEDQELFLFQLCFFPIIRLPSLLTPQSPIIGLCP